MSVATSISAPHQSERAAREQRTFRALLDGTARPGTVRALEAHPVGGPARYAVSLLEAVLDHEVTFAVLPDASAAREPLLRYTGSRAVPAGRADWLLCYGTGIASALVTAKDGDLEYPDRNATIVAMVDAVSSSPLTPRRAFSKPDCVPSLPHAGEGESRRHVGGIERLTLAGPGVRDTIDVWVAGFSAEDRIRFAARNAGLPLGIDLILLGPDGRFTCLPRYTRLVDDAATTRS